MASQVISGLGLNLALPSLLRGLLPKIDLSWDFLGGFLLAAPKKRTTHRTKRIRLAPKWLKPMKNIRRCPICGGDKLLHHICPGCLRTLKRAQ
ncbi:hypothetical protein BASA50_009515 [Batrachochytrium salamandrivorans]|uniref:Large ribosomal subunit protein bL32m n=1 Tax=Batrachochytrium salamandrivorans TaxID=1357716 RepID=A0ABQ8F190_9FUNG|nr:hypothetical protein BASA62_009831 [Batrachochytrium salamandrivorans]KAH6565161.1 hypothetical protein BASA60_010038 [Batrachochytrium salamandrivorans]KAH6585761.1 hypothetical protein BASA61_006744 [Batrachochytrium salamandrivorans]KAH6590255.1 hypothetical protein BASA50_009515 [Batrachochytrium salamandrivorans]KAH9251301.1 ribosomal protein L32 [Batrachochytrium salamandrivorans]